MGSVMNHEPCQHSLASLEASSEIEE